MADRSITLQLGATVTGFVNGMRTAQKAAEDFVGRGLDKVAKNEQSIRTLSNTAGIMGAGMVAAFGAATKAAVDWESQWAGVLKTVEGTPAQLAVLEDGLRELARTMPATHGEIAATAEAAGQLGVATEDVVEFTETMVMLGETTNMSADEAATALARISNIMGTSTADVGRMGATIVDLGNNAATTEREIVELSTRLAAAGRQAGLTEADIFAIASTMTSVGVEAEAGGTAMSKVFTSIGDAVRDGGDDLAIFAEVAGMTAQEFQRAFGEDAASAIGAFVEGMGRLGAEGESTSAVFKDLGLTDQRLMRAILSAGTATGLWAEQVELANEAWESNTALIDEAEKRFATAESQMTVAWNNIRDAAIEFGAVALPYIAELAGSVSDVARAFGELPDWVQSSLMAIVGGGGLVLLGVAGMGRLALAVNEITGAMRNVGITADLTKGKVAAVGTALSVAAFVVAADQVMRKMGEMQVAAADVADLTAEFEAMAAGAGEVGQELAGMFGTGFTWSPFRKEITTTDEAIEKFGASAREALGQGFWDRMDRIGTAGADMAKLREQTEPMDAAFAAMISNGNIEGAVTLFEQFTAAAEAQNVDMEALVAMFPQYAAALAGVDGAVASGAAAQEEFSSAVYDSNGELKSQADLLEEVLGLHQEAAGVVLSAREAERQFEASVDAVNDSLETQISELAAQYESKGMSADAARDLAEAEVEASDKLDISTEAGRRNQAALDAVADSGWAVIESAEANGATQEELQGIMSRTRDRFLAAADSMGMSSDEANRLADELGLIPSNVTANVSVLGVESALSRVGALDATLNSIDGKRVTASVAIQQYGQAALAAGGPVIGPGTGTSDSIPAMLSNGEHVLTAAEVAAAGGHGAIYALRSAIRSGAAKFAEGGAVQYVPSFASGGAVSASATNLTVYVTNPFTGEQVRAAVSSVADSRIREREWQGRGIGGSR